MLYHILHSNSFEELEKTVNEKLKEGYKLQGGISLLQLSNLIGESKISTLSNAAASIAIEILYAQAVIKDED